MPKRLSIGALILGMAWGLRLINLNGRPLWYDEAFAILYAEKSFSAILSGTLTPVQGAAADVHPIAYYYLLHGWMVLAGQTPFAVRMLSVLYGMGTVALVYRLLRELFSASAAWPAMLAVAIAPFQIAYSQEARMYAMLGFWSLAALVAFVRAWRADSVRAWLALVVCGALALYSHNLAFALFAALGIWVVVRAVYHALAGHADKAPARLALKTGLAGLGMAVLFLPWLVRVPAQLGKIDQAYWVTRPGITTLVQTLISFTFDFENAVFPRMLLLPALFGALLVLVLIIWRSGLWFRVTQERKLDRAGELALLLVLASVPVVIVFVISQWRPVYIIRGLIPASIVYVALLGWAFGAMPRDARMVFGVPLAGLVVVVLVAFYGYAGFPRGPYLALDAYLLEQERPGDAIVHSNKLTFFPAYVYDRQLPEVFLPDPPGSGSDTLARPTQDALGLYPTDLQAATQNKSRVWLVIFRQAIEEVKGPHPQVAWLDAHFDRTRTVSFGDIDVMLYVRTEP